MDQSTHSSLEERHEYHLLGINLFFTITLPSLVQQTVIAGQTLTIKLFLFPVRTKDGR